MTLKRIMPLILIVAGTVGLVCSFALMYDHIKLLTNPHYIPSCDLNPVVSCGSVISSNEGSLLFGLPNPLFGIAAFAVVITVGVAMLAGATFKRWLWLGFEASVLLGIGAVHFLIYQSVYRLNALCPFCMVVWTMVIPLFWYVTLYNIEQEFIKLPKGRITTVGNFARKHHLDILVLWFLIIAGLILKHFWYYYGKHL